MYNELPDYGYDSKEEIIEYVRGLEPEDILLEPAALVDIIAEVVLKAERRENIEALRKLTTSNTPTSGNPP